MKILHLNCQHKARANDILTQNLIDLNIDIALIQEPYISKKTNQIPSIPNHAYRQYHLVPF